MTATSQVSTLDDETKPDAPAPAAPVAAKGGAKAKAAAAAEIKGANFDAELSGKNVMITVHSAEGEGGADAVFVSLNGYAYQIPRDKPFKVPSEVAQVLADAKTTSYKNGAGGEVVETTRQRYAFSVTPVEA